MWEIFPKHKELVHILVLHANFCKYAEEYFAKFTQNQHVHEYALFYPKATILSKGNNISSNDNRILQI